MVGSFELCPLTVHSDVKQHPVVPCVQSERKRPISWWANAHWGAKQKSKDWAQSPSVAVRGSLRSKNALADFREQPSIDKDLANMDHSFHFGKVKQTKSFLVDKPSSLSALWDNEDIYYLWCDSFTGVRFSILLCAANLFMIWHCELPNVTHDNSPYSWSTNTKLTVQYQQSEVMHFN